jgi:uncharacterized membrane protein YphA (DoxX/SURF4 family)
MFNRIKSRTWVPVLLRLIAGFGFIEHGSVKLLKGPGAFAYILHGLGVPAPHLIAWLTILAELLGGFAVLLGAFVTLVSVPMAVVLLTAIFSVHWRYGFSSIKLLAVTPTGAQFGPDTNAIYSIWRAWLRWCSRVRVRFHWMEYFHERGDPVREDPRPFPAHKAASKSPKRENVIYSKTD